MDSSRALVPVCLKKELSKETKAVRQGNCLLWEKIHVEKAQAD